MSELLKIRVDDELIEEIRIDKYLSSISTYFSRSYLQKLIKEGCVSVNCKIINKSSFLIKAEDEIEVTVPEPVELNIEPADIPLNIVYEDEDILIINKPKGMVVHPSAGHYNDTLVNGLLFHCKDALSTINGVLRPGIVHRIDKDTSGLLIVCKNDNSHNSIATQLKDHSIKRTYYAIVYNNFNESEGKVDAPVGRSSSDRKKMAINYKNGKPAVTHYKVIRRFGNFTLIQCNLETGRTHQIRVHMASINHPLLGDYVYGPEKNKFGIKGQVLHAKNIGFLHPHTNEYIFFDSELTDEFKSLLKRLEADQLNIK